MGHKLCYWDSKEKCSCKLIRNVRVSVPKPGSTHYVFHIHFWACHLFPRTWPSGFVAAVWVPEDSLTSFWPGPHHVVHKWARPKSRFSKRTAAHRLQLHTYLLAAIGREMLGTISKFQIIRISRKLYVLLTWNFILLEVGHNSQKNCEFL